MFSGKIKLDYGSIRFRLTALYVTFFGATLILFSSVLYNALVRTHQRDFDIDLYNYAVDVAEGIHLDLMGNLSITTDTLSNGGKIVPFTMGSSFVQLLDPNGNPLARSRTLHTGRLPLHGDDWNRLLDRKVALRTIDKKEIFPMVQSADLAAGVSSYRLISYLVARRMTGDFILQIAVPTTFLEQAAVGLRGLLLFGIPITLVISTFAGYYFAGRALNPVNAIISKAKQLSPRNLSERIPLPTARALPGISGAGVDDELSRLVLTLNELLDRLQQAFESQERFIADASHELKTPLAILRGELDLMKSRPRTSEEVADFMTSATQEMEHLSSVVEDLLLLARVDAGTAMLSLRPTRLDEAALEALSRMELLAKPKGVKLRFEIENLAGDDATFEIPGDSDLIRIMMKNLIENAIKFSPPESTVEIRLMDSKDQMKFTVKDQGPGIPAAMQGKIFERFFRTDQKGSPPAPGAGLGLAIARRIAQAHQGTLEVQSPAQNSNGTPQEAGTIFTATLLRPESGPTSDATSRKRPWTLPPGLIKRL